MPLSYVEVVAPNAAPSQTAFFLHGILGAGRNLLTFCKQLAAQTPDIRYVLPDLRCHGDSHNVVPPHTLEACAQDLAILADSLGVRPNAILGHSFGGKVALSYAKLYGDGTETLWLLDSPPGNEPSTAGPREVERVIAALKRFSIPIATRQMLLQGLQEEGFPSTLAAWMGTNLRPVEGGFAWKFDLSAVEDLLASYFAKNFWPFVAQSQQTIHIVQAARSDRWTPSDQAELARITAKNPNIHHHILANAGHWLHVDNPQGLLSLLGSVIG